LRNLLHSLGELEYRNLDVRTDVEDLPDCFLALHELDQRADDVADVTKTAALFSIAINGDWPAGKRLLHKRRDHHSVLTGLSWSNCVEEPHDDCRELLLAPVSKRQKLIDRFRARITPAPLRRRAHNEIPVFTKRHIGAQAVYLRRRRNQHFLLFLVRERQYYLSAANVRLDGPDRTFDDQLYADCRREMKDHVALIDELRGNRMIVDRFDRVVKTRMTFDVLNILDRARREIVDDVNFVAALQISVS